MNEHLRARIELFSDNMHSLKGTFVWKSILLKRLAALLYAAKGRHIDIGALEESYALIRKSTGVFSYFRGNSAMTLSALLSFHDDKRKRLDDTLAVYHQMKAHKFWGSDYLVIAAYQIAVNAGEEKCDETIKRAKAFYDGMKAKRRFITGRSDYIFVALLGLSDMGLESGLKRIEGLYQAFKPYFRSGDGVQTLAQVLTLGDQSGDAQSRVLGLSDVFRQKGMRMDRQYTLPLLGVLSMLPVDANTLAEAVVEAHDLLRTKKGFGRFFVTNQEMRLLASALVCFDDADESDGPLLTTALSTAITSIIIAQQTAIAIAAAASSSAASSGGT